MSWSPNAANLFSELVEQQIITKDEWQRLIELLSDHANLYSALQLAGIDSKVWTYFAEQYGRTLYSRPEQLEVIYSELFDHRVSLATGLLPHRIRADELVVLGYEPRFTRVSHPQLDGHKLRVGLVAPTLWRTLYNLIFPPVLTGRLSEAEATALVTYSVAGQSTSMTPEQRAEIRAITQGYEYIEPLSNPPDMAVRHLINLTTKAQFGCYPHHRDIDALVVMMAHPDNTDALSHLREQAQMNIRTVISTQRAIDALIRAEDLESLGLETGASSPGPFKLADTEVRVTADHVAR